MANQSKANDPRFWKKWKESGAVGTIHGPYNAKLEYFVFETFDGL